jgi:hypothetical protein
MERSSFTCLAVCLAFCIAPSLSPAHAESGMRCGTKIVGTGDSTYVVRQKCGDPADVRSRVELRTISSTQQLVNGRWVQASRTEEVPIEVWTYDFGSRRFMRFVTFERGQLVDVQTGHYGTQK